jgi:hypothetical protein
MARKSKLVDENLETIFVGKPEALKADGSNFYAWRMAMKSRLNRYGLLMGLEHNSLARDEACVVEEFLIATVEPQLLCRLAVDGNSKDELMDPSKMWSTLAEIGKTASDTLVRTTLARVENLSIDSPIEFEPVIKMAEDYFAKINYPDADRKTWFRRAIAQCSKLSQVKASLAIALPEQPYSQFVDMARSILSDLKKVEQKSENRAVKICFNCKKPGHIEKYCRQAVATKGAVKSKTFATKEVSNNMNLPLTNSSRAAMSMTMIEKDAGIPKECISIKIPLNLSSETFAALASQPANNSLTEDWILDSGAANSVTYNESAFIPNSLKLVHNQYLELGDSKLVPITAVGNVKLKVFVDNASKTIVLKDVKLAPSFKFQLISIPTLVQRKCSVLLEDPWLKVFKNNDVKFNGFLRSDLDNLWCLVTKPQESTTTLRAVTRTTTSKASAYEWHLRLGHRNYSDIFEMAQKQLVDGMEITDKTQVPCDACTRAKGSVVDLPRFSDEIVDTPGTIVGDTLAFPETAFDGSNCCSVFTDVATRFSLLQPLKSKDAKSVAAHLKSVIEFFQTQTGHRVRKLITDNGLEYDNQHVRKITEAAGIRHVFTAKYTPSQNGVAERKNRTISEAVRSVLADNHDLDPKFWPQLAVSCTHIQNMVIHSKSGKTPYEMLYGRKPTVNYFRPLGCRVHVLKDGHLTKLETQREPAIFLGYEPNRRGYKIWNLSKGEFQVSRNVVFPIEPSRTNMLITPSLISKRPVYDEHNPSFEAVMKSPSLKEIWSPSILAEIANMKANDVWSLVPFDNQPLLTPKIVLREKLDENGDHKSYKARIVPKGFQQVQGRDFDDTFAPVASFSSILMLLKVAVQKNYLIHHVDFDAAFLNTPIKHDIYVRQVKHFEEGPSNLVYKLKKCIYGLKQSPRDWWLLLRDNMLNLGWKSLSADECVMVNRLNDSLSFIVIYVDDLLIFTETEARMTSIKSDLASLFRIKDLGPVKHVLGIKVTSSEKGLLLDQRVLINQYFEKYGSGTSSLKLHFPPFTFDVKHRMFTSTEYASRIGALSYLAHRTRPDVAAVTNFLARRQTCFTTHDCFSLTKVFDYLKFHENKSFLIDKGSNLDISCFVDADWGGDEIDRHSTSGGIAFVGKTPVSWYSRRQDTIALSTAESELYAITEGAKDTAMVKNLITELLTDHECKVPIMHCDNQAAIAISESKGNRRKVRHVDLRHFYIKEMIEKGQLKIEYVETSNNKSDGLTKVLPKNKLIKSINDLGLVTVD